MGLPAQLAEQLSFLALGMVRDGTGLVDGLAALVETLAEAITGYSGLQLTIVHTGHPVRLTALHPDEDRSADDHPEARSSLRFPLQLVSPAFEEGSSFVVWSTVPGSLVDLAADLGYVFRSASPDTGGLRLDVDLPPGAAVSGVDGLAELATIHQAAGLLIARGEHPDSVHATLRGGASAAGLSTHVWAAQVLRHR